MPSLHGTVTAACYISYRGESIGLLTRQRESTETSRRCNKHFFLAMHSVTVSRHYSSRDKNTCSPPHGNYAANLVTPHPEPTATCAHIICESQLQTTPTRPRFCLHTYLQGNCVFKNQLIQYCTTCNHFYFRHGAAIRRRKTTDPALSMHLFTSLGGGDHVSGQLAGDPLPVWDLPLHLDVQVLCSEAR